MLQPHMPPFAAGYVAYFLQIGLVALRLPQDWHFWLEVALDHLPMPVPCAWSVMRISSTAGHGVVAVTVNPLA